MKKINIILASLLSIGLISSTFSSTVEARTDYYSQKVTAYLAKSGALTYHGTTPLKYDTIAVHPVTYNVPTSGTLFPYGTIVYVTDGIDIPGYKKKYTYKVEDMGDVSNNRGLTRYWFDVYMGLETTENLNYANAFGVKTIDYWIQ